MRVPPPLDLHAHVDAGIDAAELTALRAIVFAVTRSLDEAEQALKRSDRTTIWGVGCGDVPAAVEFGRVAAAPVNALRQQTHRCQEISVCF